MTRRELLTLTTVAPLMASAEVSDLQRPQYHFLPLKNWMNDPNGLVWHKGKYHLFYQYNPNAAVWGDMHWGHAESLDLIHWKHLPIALAPVPSSYDKDGVFSGCCRIHNGVPTIFYTGVWPETQNVIECNDSLTDFKRYPGNPVIPHSPESLEVTAFRDPCVWQEGNDWMMAIGSGIKGGTGTVLLYSSPDVLHWTYLHSLATSTRPEDGVIWECPNFFPLGKKWVLCVSADTPIKKPFYWIGRYEKRSFRPESSRAALDYGGYYYAPQVFLDAKQRAMIIGWIPEGRTEKAQKAAGWAGVQSLPRVLDLASDGSLSMKPLPELATLRGRRFTKPQDARADSLEIVAEFEAAGDKPAGLRIRVSPDHREQTAIAYNPANKQLSVDRTQSSLSIDTDRDVRSAELDLGGGKRLRLHVFIDHSIVEVFANDRVCITPRIYPTLPDALGVETFGKLNSFEAWEIQPAVPV